MKYCKHQLPTETCEWCRKEKQGAGKWKVNIRPRTGLQIKYLRKFMTEVEVERMIDKYVEAKQSVLNKKLEHRENKKP